MRITSALSACGVFLGITTSFGAAPQLIWDPLGNNGGAASGNWDTTAANTVWWNGSADVPWTQTSTTSPLNGATFNGPSAADNTYQISLDGPQISITNNLFINNNGYAFSGSALFLGNNAILSVASGVTANFSCNMGGSGTSPIWLLGSGSTMNVTGNLTSGQQLRLAGPTNSAFNLSGASSTVAQAYILGSVNVSNGSLASTTSILIGYPTPNTINGTAYNAGTLTVGPSGTVTANGNICFVGRSFGGVGGQGTLIVNGGTFNVGNAVNRNLAICYDGAPTESGTVLVNSGSLNVGSSSFACALNFFETGAAAGQVATMIQSGGTVTAWNGILFGSAAGTYSGGSANFTQTGGTLYLGGNGIVRGSVYTAANSNALSLSLSGGTVGALGNWSSVLPLTLATSNGNVTFQCADASLTPHNIALSGTLTGTGGLNVTGGGTLTLSGPNNYSGSTMVTNGTLAIVTGSTPITNGPVLVDGSTASPTVSVQSSPGQTWNTGPFTFTNNSPNMTFQLGGLSPSPTIAPVQVSGNVTFAAAPIFNIVGTAIATGTYPLIHYTGVVAGPLPVSVSFSGGSASAGVLTNLTASKTIALVVTASSYSSALSWRVGNGAWDFVTSNWTQFSSATNYTDGSPVVFDDSASGASPITVSLNSTVNPLSVTANNLNKKYTIAGTGSITGSGSVSILGGGVFSLATSNSYSGGTTVSSGQLNINNSGNATSSAIGTGTLTLNNGALLDNTSGANVSLQPAISETWNGNFTYVGSSNDLNLGSNGTITMNQNTLVTVNGHNLSLADPINENNGSFQLTKAGSGALTLPIGNSFSGGLTLSAGRLNLADPNAAGSGIFTINGGSIDNTSGNDLTMVVLSYAWGGSFSFLGTGNLDLGFGTVFVPPGQPSLTVTVVSNTLTTEGDINSGNTTVIKAGLGTWHLGGNSTTLNNLGLVVSAGQVILNKSGQSIGVGTIGLTIQSNALATDIGNFQVHSKSVSTPVPVTLAGGTWDLNGYSENVDKLSMSGGGTLRNSASGSSTFNLISGFTGQLNDNNCQFDIPQSGAALVLQGPLGGVGSLVKTGLGTLTLLSNNIYTGNTVVANGTLALAGVGSISNSVNIILATNTSSLDLTASTDINTNSTPVLSLQSGQTLSGFGVVTGLVATVSGSVVAPGSPSTIGTLTVTGIAGANSLGGTTLMKLDKGNHTNDQLAVSGSLTLGGTLALTNLSGTLTNGDSFTLFTAGGGVTGSFANISPSRPGYPGFGLAWNTNNLAPGGVISVVTAAIPAPPKITSVTFSAGTLSVHGTNGVPNEPFVLLETTNLTVSLPNWTPVATNSFDGSGNFNVSVSVTNTPLYFTVLVQ